MVLALAAAITLTLLVVTDNVCHVLTVHHVNQITASAHNVHLEMGSALAHAMFVPMGPTPWVELVHV